MSESERSTPIEPDKLDTAHSQEVREQAHDERSIAAESRISIVSQEFSGPLPHPAVLQQYEEIQPGFADRILRMAEQQGQHRQQNIVDNWKRRRLKPRSKTLWKSAV
ncbi:MAG: DUF2335 domain-containing protein [Planctomycetaceae bacterium]